MKNQQSINCDAAYVCFAAVLSLQSMWCFTGGVSAQTAETQLHRNMVGMAQMQVNDFHQDAASRTAPIRLVYFHAADREPLPGWRPRLTRIANDVEQFYNEGMEELGAKNARVEFERDADGLVIHVVQGRGQSEVYSYDSGNRIEREIQSALEDKFELSDEFVLAIHGLCDKDEDGKYLFHAPYYGRGNPRNGFCHAADCELLDPENLTVTDKNIVYGEHYYKEKKQTIAKFNSWYIGGIAHELGHGLSLPHDVAAPRYQSKRTGFSLMGMGNHHYREDLWGGREPSYLSIGSVLRLLSHPTVTRSDRDRLRKPETKLNDLEFFDANGSLKVKAKVESDMPSYAVIGYLWYTKQWPGNSRADHRSYSYPVVLNTNADSNSFELDLGQHPPGHYRLRLCVLHPNGSQSRFDYHAQFDRDRHPNATELNESVILNQAVTAFAEKHQDAKQVIAKAQSRFNVSDETKSKLKILAESLQPPAGLDLKDTTAKQISLSDATWESAKVGWGELARNRYDLGQWRSSGVFLQLSGEFHRKGLYAHSPSQFVFDIDKRWKTFTAKIGLQDGAQQQGSAVFRVIGDGKLLYQSKVLRAGQTESLEMDISDVSKLQLTTSGGEGHNHNSWAIWGSPILRRP